MDLEFHCTAVVYDCDGWIGLLFAFDGVGSVVFSVRGDYCRVSVVLCCFAKKGLYA